MSAVRLLLADDHTLVRAGIRALLEAAGGVDVIAEGKSTKEIAQVLDLSVKTVETHRMRIMERLGIHDVAGLVRFAIRAGLVSSQE